MTIKTALLNTARALAAVPPLNAARRAAGTRRQLAQYERILGKVLASSGRYDLHHLAHALESKRSARLGPSGDHSVGIAAMGARDWEERGLWQAFAAAGDFSLFDKRAPSIGSARGLAERRDRLGALFIQHIDEREATGRPVHLAFFYADGSEVGPRTLDALQERGIWTAMMCLDDKQLLPGRPLMGLVDWQLEVAREVDVYWTTWRSGADWLMDEGVTAWYAPEAADPDLFCPPLAERRSIDVLWIGSSYGPRRTLVDGLRRRGLSVVARGAGWPGGPVSFDGMVDLVGQSSVVLGMGGVGHADTIRCLKGRDFEFPMCGALYVTGYNPELADHYDIGKEIVCYSTPIDCAETIHWLLHRPAEARAIRQAARLRCERNHTWRHRIADLLGMLHLPMPADYLLSSSFQA